MLNTANLHREIIRKYNVDIVQILTNPNLHRHYFSLGRGSCCLQSNCMGMATVVLGSSGPWLLPTWMRETADWFVEEVSSSLPWLKISDDARGSGCFKSTIFLPTPFNHAEVRACGWLSSGYNNNVKTRPGDVWFKYHRSLASPDRRSRRSVRAVAVTMRTRMAAIMAGMA